jgi:hypothetical protein
MVMATRQKTRQSKPATKADLNKILDRLEGDVEEKSDIWLGIFTDILPLCISEDKQLEEENIVKASELADVVLREYENRWCVAPLP